jgi:hypothetical protein
MIQSPPQEWLAPLSPLYSYLLGRLSQIGAGDPSMIATSWYRSDSENRRVGGHPESQHLFGFALDVVSENPEYVVTSSRSLGLVAVDEIDHVHIQIFPAGFLRSLGLFS